MHQGESRESQREREAVTGEIEQETRDGRERERDRSQETLPRTSVPAKEGAISGEQSPQSLRGSVFAMCMFFKVKIAAQNIACSEA